MCQVPFWCVGCPCNVHSDFRAVEGAPPRTLPGPSRRWAAVLLSANWGPVLTNHTGNGLRKRFFAIL
eukprot:12467404-Alexandrium_andersonii.AAC.1